MNSGTPTHPDEAWARSEVAGGPSSPLAPPAPTTHSAPVEAPVEAQAAPVEAPVEAQATRVEVAPAEAPAKPRPALRAGLAGGIVGAVVAALVSGVVLWVDDDTAPGSSAPAPTVATTAPAPEPGAPATVPASPAGPAPVMDVKAVLARVSASVVSIETGQVGRNGGVFGTGAGSGVILSADGLVVTNAHVIAGADAITVKTFDGTEYPAEFVGSQPSSDLALLRVRNATGLTPIALGSSDALGVGDEVLAIGNALNLDGKPTVTRGIVSAKERSLTEPGGASIDHLIQTDAAINPGNSGGALVNAAGELVGINTAIIQDSQNIGFAIAVDAVKPVIERLKSGQGEVRSRAFLGVTTEAADGGLLVLLVQPGSAAEDVGLEVGDVLVSIEGTALSSPTALRDAIRGFEPGTEVTLVWLRDGQERSGSVALGSTVEQGQ